MNTEASNTAFLEAYKRLNDEQKKAVDTIEGPVMVIAGPGTGKTQILTLRIANILRSTDTAPENILALTFTESGQQAMRSRLRTYIGTDAYRVPIFTFHSFAERCIKAHPDAFTRIIGGNAISDLDAYARTEDLLSSLGIKKLRPVGDPRYHVRSILDAIRTMKREYVSPDDFATYIHEQETKLQEIPKLHEKGAHKGKVRSEYKKAEDSLIKNQELLTIYRAYEAMLAEERWYDYEDMIVELVHALEHDEGFRLELQETYQYILADEHQDVNGSQNRILELLANFHEQPNIFVVGDEKQAIYRFQGASLENFLYFEELFPGTTTISLTQNYRSGQTILDAAHSLVAVEDGPLAELRVPLTAAATNESNITLAPFAHEAVEDEYVIDEIKKILTQDVPAEEVALIVRTNREVEYYASRLRNAGVPTEASADGDILSHPLMHTISNLIEATVHPESEPALFAVLHGQYWKIPAADLFRVCGLRSGKRPLSAVLADAELLQKSGVTDMDAVQQVSRVLEEARSKMAVMAPQHVAALLITKSGLLDEVLAADSGEAGRVIRRLYDEIERIVVDIKGATLAEVATTFKRYREYGLALTAPYIKTGAAAVQVMTAHKAKGLEFAHVFLPHLTDNVWGGGRKRSSFDLPLTKHIDPTLLDAEDDERRLFYVALTRAKTDLHLSYAEENANGRSLTMSRLVGELDASCVQELDTSAAAAAFDPTTVLGEHTSPAVTPALIKQLFLERGLSATSLNNYLSSPWNYIYRNLLRIPEVQTLSLLYGTAIHGVLERCTRAHTIDSALPSMSDIRTMLGRELERLPLSHEDHAQLHEKGLEALAVYREHLDATVPKRTSEEFSLRVVLPTDDKEIPEITLTGKLDRLDFDEEGRVTRVVDYKTGKPKTKGQIVGTTKDSNGDYKRQLVFYALLLELYDDERYRCRDCVLSFVEPDKNGAVREEAFTITDDEIEALKQEILRIGKEIVSGECLLVSCDPTQSDYCHLVAELAR